MLPKTKAQTTPADETSEDETPPVLDNAGADEPAVARPRHAGEICPEGCGQLALDPSATHFACEHGSWDLSDTAV